MAKTQTATKKGVANPGVFPLAPLSELSRIRIFRDIPQRSLLLLDGKVRRAKAEAEETILELADDTQPFRYFFFIVSGQVKVVGYDEEARLKPLNFLRKGEFFVDKTVAWRGQVATKVAAICDSEFLILPRDELRALASQHPPFHERLKALTERVDYRNRIYSEDKYARSVLEFLIDKELTQASRVKITQMDKCIECDVCYTSCEDRHGFQRLERGYARFGVLDFAQSCLTCFYPTCIPSCPVDSVVFNAERGEVEILDDCIGCSACARACQYGAIKMYKANPEEKHHARFFKPDKKIQPKFIADKCNHCHGYEDMACITGCPTGAIIEIEATDLLENPRIFGTGAAKKHVLPSRMQRSWLDLAIQRSLIILGAMACVWISFEAYALNHLRTLSPLVALQKAGFIPADFNLKFEMGSNFNNFLGNIGFLLILLGMTYPLRKGFPRLFKYLGKFPAWLDFHNFCGALGTVLILFHTGFQFPMSPPVKIPGTLGFFFLLAVALSGIFGRFLYQMIPRGMAGTELQAREVEEEEAAITEKLEALSGGNPRVRSRIDQIVASVSGDTVLRPTLTNLIRSIWKTHAVLFQLRFRLPREFNVHKQQVSAFLDLLHEKIRLKRNLAYLGLTSRLFIQWKFIHRPFAYAMGVMAIIHVVRNLLYFPNL